MPHEIIMPVLGMNQDTGVIAEWNKQAGDYVKKGDVVMSVETDKAVQEIEALHEGYLAQVKYGEGAEVPVGDVVAILTEETQVSTAGIAEAVAIEVPAQTETVKPETPVHEFITSGKAESTVPLTSVQSAITQADKQSRKQQGNDADKKILASPKAKRMAVMQGLDLKALVMQGKPQPYYATDVEKYQPVAVATATGVQVSARVTSQAIRQLCVYLQETCEQFDEQFVLIGLVSRAARCSGLYSKAIYLQDCVTETYWQDADLVGIGSIQLRQVAAASPPEESIYFWNFTNDDIDALSVREHNGLNLTISGMDDWTIQVDFHAGCLGTRKVVTFVKQLTAHIKQPLLLLL